MRGSVIIPQQKCSHENAKTNTWLNIDAGASTHPSLPTFCSSVLTCSHKGAYCVIVLALMKQQQTPPFLSDPSPAPTSLMNSMEIPPYYSWAAISIVMCTHTEEEKRGECLGERSQLWCVSVCVRLKQRERSDIPADAWTAAAAAEAAAAHLCMLSCYTQLEASSASELALAVWMWDWDAPEEMLAKEWLMTASNSAVEGTPCMRTITTRGNLDAWRFHDNYNGLQSVHFTEARGTLQATLWDCTGELGL